MRKLDPPIALGELARALGLNPDPAWADRAISRLAPLESAGDADISFLADARYVSQLGRSGAAAVLLRRVHASQAGEHTVALVVDDPYVAFARVSQLFEARLQQSAATADDIDSRLIDRDARISERATVGSGVRVGRYAQISEGCLIGNDAAVSAGCVVGADVTIGERTVLGPNVTVYRDSQIGADCVIQAGTVIGSDGFGFAPAGTRWERIAQLGAVRIGDRVHIGANCTIDRGAIDDTTIDDDCILDNLIQVAHNVRIGAGSALAGCVGIAGSAVLGRGCLIGGGAGILGHLRLADGVILSPMSLATRSINKAGFYSGSFPLMDNAQWEKAAAVLRRLPDLRSRLRHLEQLTRESE